VTSVTTTRDDGLAPEQEPGRVYERERGRRSRERLRQSFDEEDAKVIVTYDENGFYGHPRPHSKPTLSPVELIELSNSVELSYYSVVPAGVMTSLVDQATAEGLAMPAWCLMRARSSTTMSWPRLAGRQ